MANETVKTAKVKFKKEFWLQLPMMLCLFLGMIPVARKYPNNLVAAVVFAAIFALIFATLRWIIDTMVRK